MLNENIKIQYSLSPEGEYKINGIGKVDGYCLETNTVYEYHGDYWHGNPLVFDGNDSNKTLKKQFKELYNKTIARDNKIRELGYLLILFDYILILKYIQKKGFSQLKASSIGFFICYLRLIRATIELNNE